MRTVRPTGFQPRFPPTDSLPSSALPSRLLPHPTCKCGFWSRRPCLRHPIAETDIASCCPTHWPYADRSELRSWMQAEVENYRRLRFITRERQLTQMPTEPVRAAPNGFQVLYCPEATGGGLGTLRRELVPGGPTRRVAPALNGAATSPSATVPAWRLPRAAVTGTSKRSPPRWRLGPRTRWASPLDAGARPACAGGPSSFDYAPCCTAATPNIHYGKGRAVASKSPGSRGGAAAGQGARELGRGQYSGVPRGAQAGAGTCRGRCVSRLVDRAVT